MHCVERYLGLSPHISGTGTACSTRAFLFFTLRRVAWLWVAKNQQHTEIDQGHPSHLHICILPPSAPLFSADVGPALGASCKPNKALPQIKCTMYQSTTRSGGMFARRAPGALLLDYVPPEEPPSTPLGNALRIR